MFRSSVRALAVSTALLLISVSLRSAQADSAAFPNDPLFPKQWYLHNTGQSGGKPGADIHALEAWNLTKCSADEIIGMLDTGVTSSHPEFSGKLLTGAIYVPGATSTEDGLNHGTATAGVVAANTDNGQGIAGICPYGRILPVKVANDQGHTDDPEVGLGIQWAVDHGARVINLSLGTEDVPQMRDAAAYAYAHNVVLVAAAGPGEVYPADYPHVIAVGGSDKNDHALGTPPHATHDLVVAPDASVITTSNDGSYTVFCTCVSIAAPMVTGTVALLQSLRPDMTVDQIVDAVENGADPIDGQTGFNTNDGWGRVNAYRSLLIAQKLPRFTLKVSVKSGVVARDRQQTIAIRSLPGTKITVKLIYPGKKKSTRSAEVGADGKYSYTWKAPKRTGPATAEVDATHGFVTKKRTVHFTIR